MDQDWLGLSVAGRHGTCSVPAHGQSVCLLEPVSSEQSLRDCPWSPGSLVLQLVSGNQPGSRTGTWLVGCWLSLSPGGTQGRACQCLIQAGHQLADRRGARLKVESCMPVWLPAKHHTGTVHHPRRWARPQALLEKGPEIGVEGKRSPVMNGQWHVCG